MFTVNLADLGRFGARVRLLTIFARPNDPILLRAAGDLMESWERRMEQGNRKGVLAGLDKDGHPAPKPSYRPFNPQPKLTLAQRLGQRANLRRGKYNPGAGANLTTAEYRRLTGPFLAPRKQFSRSITNVESGQYPRHDRAQPFIWTATIAWRDVVSRTGFHFLPVFFDGLPIGRNGPRKRYDLRGVRPVDGEKMRGDFQAWAKLLIRGHFGE